jgi:hypothetical protein
MPNEKHARISAPCSREPNPPPKVVKKASASLCSGCDRALLRVVHPRLSLKRPLLTSAEEPAKEKLIIPSSTLWIARRESPVTRQSQCRKMSTSNFVKVEYVVESTDGGG